MPSRTLNAVLSAIFFVALSSLGFDAYAHSTSTAYLEVDASAPSAPTLQWRIALRDLDALLDIDTNGDGQLIWGEVADRAADVMTLAASRISITSGATACTLRLNSPRYVRLADAGYAHVEGTADCDADGALTLDYRLFDGVDPSHRVLVSVRGASQPRIAAPGATVALQGADSATDAPSGFSGFLWSGIEHIAGGFDHLLFLLTLLLPSVVQRRAGHWMAQTDISRALMAVIWIVTAFTLAHSLTLALASFGFIRIPARVIEPLIALTILATALNNVWPVVTRRLAAVAFGFGLIHGIGFAEVLAPLSLPRGELALALLGFNLGVEIGQISIVAAAFMVLAAVRRWSRYPRWVLGLGSAVIAHIATLWFIERVFDVSILGF